MKKSIVTEQSQRTMESSPKLVYYATRSGGTTLDTSEGGGNPFASALIEVAGERTLKLRNLATRLRKLTVEKSNGHQHIECSGEIGFPAWRFVEDFRFRREQRNALVLVVSDYSDFHPGASLIGAASDERRIASMLAKHGFSVDQGIKPRRSEIIKALSSFRRHSQRSEIAVIYSTGHGIEFDGVVYLLPGDYPIREGLSGVQLKRHAISVTQMTNAASARGQNIVFFAGCRSQVFQNNVLPKDLGKTVS